MKNILSYKVKQSARWLLSQPKVQRIRQRYPKATEFVRNRFNAEVFVGLPLTLVVAVLGVNMALLSELTESVIDSEWVVTLDMRFTAMLYSIRSEWLSYVLFAFTKLGNRETVFIVGGVVTAIFLYRKRFVAILAFWLALAGVGITVQYGKTIISRDRPAKVAYYPVDNFSFPSGHATTVVALYGMLAYFLYRHFNSPRYQRLTIWASAVLVVIVGFSRIYLGVHYLSDVLAGFMLGALWLLVGISLMEVMMYRKNRKLFNRT